MPNLRSFEIIYLGDIEPKLAEIPISILTIDISFHIYSHKNIDHLEREKINSMIESRGFLSLQKLEFVVFNPSIRNPGSAAEDVKEKACRRFRIYPCT